MSFCLKRDGTAKVVLAATAALLPVAAADAFTE